MFKYFFGSNSENSDSKLEDSSPDGTNLPNTPPVTHNFPLFPTMIDASLFGSQAANTIYDPENDVLVRSKHYITNSIKTKFDQMAHYELIGADLVYCDIEDQVVNAAKCQKLSFSKARRKGFKRFVFMINFRLGFGNLVIYWTPRRSSCCETATRTFQTDSSTLNRLLEKFIQGSKDTKENYFKIIPVIRDGHWVVNRVLSQRPCIICKKIETEWFQNLEPNENYIEASINISSSSIASGILYTVKQYTSQIVFDLAFTLEGKNEEELPEELLLSVRFNKVMLEQGLSMQEINSDDELKSKKTISFN